MNQKVLDFNELIRTTKKISGIGKRILTSYAREVRIEKLGNVFLVRPSTLNLLVNDICNSRCQMCNIWQQKRDKELSPDDLGTILSNPLFSKLKYIGVSGGEPTLRADLPNFFQVLSNKQPKLQGMGIITNAINVDDVINRILSSANICHQAKIAFNIMVSLDGIGDIHDHIRGKRGNFDNAIKVIRFFKDKTEIPVSIGCTITKDNLWYVDEVLDYCLSEKLYGRFRIAEFIQRLYNMSQKDFIRNFNKIESYHLGLFFAKLEYTYESDPTIRRTYRNIRRMLMEEDKRSISCPGQTEAITLDSRGQLLYCSPRSPILGDTLEFSAEKLYSNNFPVRKTIIANHCKDCIHDYHSPETASDLRDRINRFYWQKRNSIDQALKRAEKVKTSRKSLNNPNNFRLVMIIGWYGTETAGDKAILDELIHQIHQRSSNSKIMIASLYPFLTKWTLRELGHLNIEILPTYSKKFWDYCSIVEEVIMGGGPLMHIDELGVILTAFTLAKRKKHHTWIAGCGIGPLDRGEKYRHAVTKILSFADEIELRDTQSLRIAQKMTNRSDILVTGDKAEGFVARWKANSTLVGKKPILNLFLREWTQEYQGKFTTEEFYSKKARFEDELSRFICEVCTKYYLIPRLLPMHHFCIGNDDRDFNRSFCKKYLSDLFPILERKPLSVSDILSIMLEGKCNICMRYHSVLFAHSLSIPFIAIDYTNNGKITNYLIDHNSSKYMISIDDIASGLWPSFLGNVNLPLNNDIR